MFGQIIRIFNTTPVNKAMEVLGSICNMQESAIFETFILESLSVDICIYFRKSRFYCNGRCGGAASVNLAFAMPLILSNMATYNSGILI